MAELKPILGSRRGKLGRPPMGDFGRTPGAALHPALIKLVEILARSAVEQFVAAREAAPP